MNSDESLIESIANGDVREVLDGLKNNEIDGQYRGRTPLLWAIQEGQTAVVEALLSAGASVSVPDSAGFTPLYQAASEGYMDIIKLLLEAKADVNQDTPHGSPLLLAVAYEHLEAVALLLDRGADPDKANAEGETPRSTATSYGNKELMCLFE